MSPGVNQHAIPPRQARSLARDLLDWYADSARDLPWRHSRDPYGIWISEVMLQQTRVEVVLGRWQKFLDRFPDIGALASASESELLAEWAGLGYYRRVRSLHRAARELGDRGVTELPRSAAELRLLPGFGAYTSGAVASIAFGERVAAVDGNVERVFARLLALDSDPAKGEAKKVVHSAALALLDRAEPGDLNQALMELGATVCTPRSPGCETCPWSGRCRARALGAPTDYPRRPAPRRAEEVFCFVAVARDASGRMLFRRRPEGGHNAGLWELPSTQFHPVAPAPDPASALETLADALDRRWKISEPLTQVRHSITHHRITAVAHAVEDSSASADGIEWIRPEDARNRGLTASTAKILDRLPTLL
jgi:A/G-specific adenine glycosylase